MSPSIGPLGTDRLFAGAVDVVDGSLTERYGELTPKT
jgi:hypothetical protein